MYKPSNRLWDTSKKVSEVRRYYSWTESRRFSCALSCCWRRRGRGPPYPGSWTSGPHPPGLHSTVHIRATQFWDGILEWHFKSRFLGINSSLLRLEFSSGFLPSFFTQIQWRIRFRNEVMKIRIFLTFWVSDPDPQKVPVLSLSFESVPKSF
jgi:hypothetical protein